MPDTRRCLPYYDSRMAASVRPMNTRSVPLDLNALIILFEPWRPWYWVDEMTGDTYRIAITGVTRGLGRALAEGMAREGHVIFGCARSHGGIEKLRSAMRAPHAFRVVDVSDPAAVEKWAREIISDGGAPDIVINNAGLINSNAPLWEVPPEEFSRVIDVNLKGTAFVMRAFLPSMIERGAGVIVNMSSGWGRSVSPSVAPYCATKWGIEGLSAAVSREVPRGLAVVALNPGVINTQMLQSAFGAGASASPDPKDWAVRAVPCILRIGPENNGDALSVS